MLIVLGQKFVLKFFGKKIAMNRPKKGFKAGKNLSKNFKKKIFDIKKVF